jgi:hypothetical protein
MSRDGTRHRRDTVACQRRACALGSRAGSVYSHSRAGNWTCIGPSPHPSRCPGWGLSFREHTADRPDAAAQRQQPRRSRPLSTISQLVTAPAAGPPRSHLVRWPISGATASGAVGSVIEVVLPPLRHQGHKGQPVPRTAAGAITPGRGRAPCAPAAAPTGSARAPSGGPGGCAL